MAVASNLSKGFAINAQSAPTSTTAANVKK